MKTILKHFFSPLFSLFILTIGMSLFTTLTTIKLHHLGSSTFTIGLISSSYYVGFVVACFVASRLIYRVAHIRAYAAFASLFATIAILQGFMVNPIFWFFARLIAGFCSAGLFVVIESWLLCENEVAFRGMVLSLYMIVYYLAQSLGQYLFQFGDLNTLFNFALTAMLCSLSVVPLAITKIATPQFSKLSTLNFATLYRLSPSGVMGSFISGCVLGPIYGLLPLTLAIIYPDNLASIANLMALTIIGGVALQYPFGKISDLVNRRYVIIAAFVLLLIASTLIQFTFNNSVLFGVAIFFIGGASFVIYPLSISHACDVINHEDITTATQSLVLINSIGMVVGPLMMPVLTHYWPKIGFFAYFAVLSLIMIVFFAWRQKTGIKVLTEDQTDFIALSRTTPIAVEMDPRGEEDFSVTTQSH